MFQIQDDFTGVESQRSTYASNTCLSLFNTRTKKKERFVPQVPNTILLYVCGITPYDSCHLGHARCYVTFDVLKRYATYKGYHVKHVQNFTDIDDKIIARSKERGMHAEALAHQYIEEFFSVMDALNVQRADEYPRVTTHIPDIITAVNALIEKGYAYTLNGDVYFRVRKFSTYGALSGKNIDELESGARVDVNEQKEDPLDFALWKAAKPGEPSWDAPFGKGRPAWHIECSVLSTKYLGDTIDIHAGGADLIFPHHENEIAQSEALTGKQFVRYWMHNGFVMINKEKMSKSLGNIFALRDIFEKYEPIVVRTFLLTQHYRSPSDFSVDKLDEAKKRLERFRELGLRTQTLKQATLNDDSTLTLLEHAFCDAMDDDLNTAGAFAALHSMVDHANKHFEESGYTAWRTIVALGDVLGIHFESLCDTEFDEEIEGMITERNAARAQKNWKRADEIRMLLDEQGVVLEDTASGTRWKRKN